MYNSEDMRLMGGVPGQQLFIYRSEEPKPKVEESGYFSDAVDDNFLSTGDIIIACTGDNMSDEITLLVATVNDGHATVVAG